MKKAKNIKTIPLFASEVEEAKFWDSVDSTQYFSGKGAIHLKMPARTTTISLRLPHRLLNRLKKLADSKDVPYQSLLKIYLDEKVGEEIATIKKRVA
ncbi:MAG: BrnA antitoxin family protein [Deltaproteobacteria bacterium]|nr:BrnA antitoxin family protein [Deltaproteobacteria bacterium]